MKKSVLILLLQLTLFSMATPAAEFRVTTLRAAQKAGFKNRADLGFYLRSLLSRHHDTLAVPVGD